ncbi:MAG: patatin-like phospholipase family protein [Deltaproteobacteria bacterium]|nr:MAG: patatin-like phospholipase family protein [Deltaproteobacteria bacterium]
MTENMLSVYAGRIARERLADQGWDPDLFSLLLGASGGPKWLVLSQLDRVLFDSFLPKRSHPLHILGTSIGSWRHACMAQSDPVAAIERMEEAYIQQEYDENPSPQEVSRVSLGILQHILGDSGVQQIVENERFLTHIGTARGKGLLASRRKAVHLCGLVLAACSNAIHRSWLQPWYQRVMFSRVGDAGQSGMSYSDFQTTHVSLTEENAVSALMASASIPLVLDGVGTPEGAPHGTYWDGGLIDYHHDLRLYQGDGLIIYPHFYPYLIPGWLDKSFPRRRAQDNVLDRVVLLCPSPAFVEKLPGSKIPDRKDFSLYSTAERIKVWWQITSQCRVLADELHKLWEQSDPLQGVAPFPEHGTTNKQIATT